MTFIHNIFTCVISDGLTRIAHSVSDSGTCLQEHQLKEVQHLLTPKTIAKFPNTEFYTIIPVYFKLSGEEGYSMHKSEGSKFAYLFTISRYNNHLTNTLSMVISIPLFEVLKPLLYYLLHTFSETALKNVSLLSVLQSLNSSYIYELIEFYKHLNMPSRYVLTRLQSQKTLNLPETLVGHFTDSGNLYKTKIRLNDNNLEFPIQIPKSSVVASPVSMFGIDLRRSSLLKDFVTLLNSINLSFDGFIFKETSMTPYESISPLHIVLNALILKKKIIIYANKSSYNQVNEISELLFLIFTSSGAPNSSSDLPYYPILDIENLDLIKSQKCYLIGTSNPLLMSKLKWNVFINLDANTMFVHTEEDYDIDEAFFNKTKNENTSDIINSLNTEILSSERCTNNAYSMKPSNSSNLSIVDCISHTDKPLQYWNSEVFPRILTRNELNNCEKLYFSKNKSFSKHSFVPSKFPFLSTDSSIPTIDLAFNVQLAKLIKDHHDDETLFTLITNYLRNLTANVLPAFHHFTTYLKIRDFKAHLSISHMDENHEVIIRDFVDANNLIQSFPINFAFSTECAFLDDANIASHYAKIVIRNVSLLRLAVHYNSILFDEPKSYPGYLFSWNGGKQNVGDSDIIARFDVHYLVSLIDKMVNEDSGESWKIDENFLLQIFKPINSILKNYCDNSNGLAEIFMDFFIEKRGDESLTKSTGINLYSFLKDDIQPTYLLRETSNAVSTNSLSTNEEELEVKLRRLAVSSGNEEFVKDAIRETAEENVAENLDMKHSKARCSKSSIHENMPKVKDDISFILSNLANSRFIKLLLIASLFLPSEKSSIIKNRQGKKPKNLVTAEFKKFFGYVLNDPFFKAYILPNIDDFVKLCINDFIDRIS